MAPPAEAERLGDGPRALCMAWPLASWLPPGFAGTPFAAVLDQGDEDDRRDLRAAVNQRDSALASFERVEWFQSTLDALWPALRGFLEKDLLRKELEPALAKAVPGLSFGSTALGDEAPKIHGVKSVVCPSRPGQPEQVMLVVDIGFYPRSSLNLALALGPLRAAVTELSFRGRLCVCLVGIVPRLPIVSGVKVFFANSPSLSFSFSGLAKALPFPPQKVKEFILEAIAKILVLPHALNVHLDTLLERFREPDFLDYQLLHSVPPAGILRIAIAGIEGLSVHAFGPKRSSFLGGTSQSPTVYALLRVGCQSQRTNPMGPVGDTLLAWQNQEFSFIVDSLVDQDVHFELYQQDNASLLIKCDELVFQAKISIAEIAEELADDDIPASLDKPSVHVPLGEPGARKTPKGAAAILTGSYHPLVATPPTKWDNSDCLLLLIVDCVVGLPDTLEKRRLSVHAGILSNRGGPASRASTVARVASRGRVAEERALSTIPVFDALRVSEIKARLRLLRQRGGRLTAREVRWLLPQVMSIDEAQRLMLEVSQEYLSPDVSAEETHSSVEVLFEEQLRLEVRSPLTHGLRVELRDEKAAKTVGIVEWSSLAWLARTPGLEDEVQAYSLDTPPAMASSWQRGRGVSACAPPKIFLKRSLQRLESEGYWRKVSLSSPRRRSFISEADASPKRSRSQSPSEPLFANMDTNGQFS